MRPETGIVLSKEEGLVSCVFDLVPRFMDEENIDERTKFSLKRWHEEVITGSSIWNRVRGIEYIELRFREGKELPTFIDALRELAEDLGEIKPHISEAKEAISRAIAKHATKVE